MASRMNVSFLQELLNSIAEQGRHLLPRSLGGSGREDDITELALALVSNRGEASGVAIARELLRRYRAARHDRAGRLPRFLARTMQPDAGEAARAAQALPIADPTPASMAALQRAVESPRLEFFRRLNLAPGATAADRRHAPRPDRCQRSIAARRRQRPPPSAHVLVQSRLPGPAPHRLANAGNDPRQDHRLRGGARDPGLGRSAPPPRSGRPALLCLLPSLPCRRAAHLRGGGPDGRHPGIDRVGAAGSAQERWIGG